MANKKISQLTAATTPLAGTETMVIVQGGVSKKVAVSEVGGGGSQTLQEVLTTGAVLTEDNTIDAAGRSIIIQNASSIDLVAGTPDFSGVTSEGKIVPDRAYFFSQNSDGTNSNIIEAKTSDTDARFKLSGSFNNDAKVVSLIGIADATSANIVSSTILDNDFADDAAAATGLVPIGGLYHSSGTVKVRLA